MDLSKLKAPFPSDKIHWRVGATNKEKTSGLALSYIDARDLYERLDEVCGAENWQIRYPHAGDKTTCEIGIRINGEWVWKANGAGDTATEAEKGAYSDAAKRAGVPWGIAAYLYDLKDVWAEIDGYKKFKPSERSKLRDAHEKLIKSMTQPVGANEIAMITEEIASAPTIDALKEIHSGKLKAMTARLNDIQKQQISKLIAKRKAELSPKDELTEIIEAAE